jgi:hypothetical protein
LGFFIALLSPASETLLAVFDTTPLIWA